MEENIVLDLSNFSATALVFSQLCPRAVGLPRLHMMTGGFGVEFKQRYFPLFVEDFKAKEKLGSKWPVHSLPCQYSKDYLFFVLLSDHRRVSHNTAGRSLDKWLEEVTHRFTALLHLQH